MSEIFRGARYTFGGLIVATLWSLGMVEFVEWKLGYNADQMAIELAADDKSLMRFGPDPDASDAEVQRYNEQKAQAGE
jgi:hypothetical protein